MGIETRHMELHPNQTAHVEFNDPVFDYVLGIEYFRLSYSSDSSDFHYVKELSVRLYPNLVDGHTVAVTPHVVLCDAKGHNIDVYISRIIVTCLAVTGGPDYNIQLANLTDVKNRSQLSTPTSPSVRAGFASGFRLQYPQDEHALSEVTFGVGANAHSSRTATLDGWALMHNNSNPKEWSSDLLNSAEVDGGLIALSRSVDQIVVTSSQVLQDPDGRVSVDVYGVPDGKKIVAGVALIQSFRVISDSEHQIHAIGGGSSGVTVKGRDQLELTYPGAILELDGHPIQDDAQSGVRFLLVGLVGPE